MKHNKAIQKTLLVNPPNTAFIQEESGNINFGKIFPLGLAYIAGYLDSLGYSVEVLDASAEGFDHRERIDREHVRVGLSDEALRDRIKKIRPDMVGISNLFSMQAAEADHIAHLTKEIFPDVPVVVGGPHPSSVPEEALKNPDIDYVVIGEGEKTMGELIEKLNKGRSLDSQKALGYRNLKGNIQINPEFNFIEDIDSIPYPAYHLFDMSIYFGKMSVHGARRTNRFIPVITSRGCPLECTFCTAHKVWGKKYRYRSPEAVVAELEFLKNEYGIKEVIFEDDNITLNKRRAEKLFDLMIERNLDLIWTVPNGIALFTVDQQLLRKMKDSGCYKVNFAIESGSQRVLDEVIHKPMKLKRVIPLINYAKKIGLEVGAFFIIGMPGETLDEIRQTFRFIRKHGISTSNISLAVPLPGSALYEIVQKNNYFVHSRVKEKLSLLHPRRYNIQTPDWNADELQRLVRYETAKTKIYIMLTQPHLLLHFFSSNLLKYIFKRIWYELTSLLKGFSKRKVSNTI